MKRKILFVVTYFDCGGINRALQNFLLLYDTRRYDISVFGMVPDGMFARLYKNCRILPRDICLSALMTRFSHQKVGLLWLFSLVVKLLNIVTKGYLGKRIKKRSAKRLLRHGYDTVIAFSEGAPTYFVSLMNHPYSIAWIHCDYVSYRQFNRDADEFDLYSTFRHIVCVADYTRHTFLSYYPKFAGRTVTVYNLLDVKMIQTKAVSTVNAISTNSCFKIVSVGRLDPVKRLSVVPYLAKQLVEAGCEFQWFIIGPKGGTQDEYERLLLSITDQGMSEYVFYVGEKDNPYPFIEKADLLVNTSLSEACPYVINEAKVLHTPVICTDFGSSKEFIQDGVNGFIRPIESISDAIIEFITNIELQIKIKNNLNHFEYNNSSILEQIYRIID